MKKKVVIVGGGFGGLAAAKKFSHTEFDVTLIDKRNYHLFQPLLYQVATAALSPADIAYPLRAVLRAPNIEILLGHVSEINKEEKWLKTLEGNKVEFDYLILACGSTYTYFNSPHFEENAPGLKNISQATEIRRKVLMAFEEAERETDPKKREAQMTFVIVGGGPTGVELAGAVGEIACYSLVRDFHHINPSSARVILIEAAPRVLATMPEDLSNDAVKQLQDLGVEIRTGTKVLDVTDEGIRLSDEFIPSKTILWAAGVAAVSLNKKLGVELDRKGLVIVGRDCAVKNYPYLFVIGDQAHHEYGPQSTPLPGLAPVAMQQGRYVAKIIKKEVRTGRTDREPFRYVDKGQMATIGRSRAVAMYKGIHFSGFLAWMAWIFVHVYYLIGFKTKLFVLIQWAWTYMTYKRGARLIVEDETNYSHEYKSARKNEEATPAPFH
jgi:NADH dehydrogenase